MDPKKPSFEPVPEREGVSNPATNPLVELSYLLAGAAALFAVIFFGAGWIGEAVAVRLSPATEKSWFGDIALKQLDEKLKPHPGMQKLLEEMFPNDAKYLRVHLSCDDAINAFAVPGGRIHVTGKLLEAVPSKGGIAFVLGHEVGHFRQRDHLRGLGRAFAGIIVSTILGFGEAPTLNGEVAQGLVERTFSRGQEAGADEVAMKTMAERYGSLSGAEQLFQKLHAEEGGHRHVLPALLSTHPHPESRLAVIQARAKQLKDSPELRKPHGFTACPSGF